MKIQGHLHEVVIVKSPKLRNEHSTRGCLVFTKYGTLPLREGEMLIITQIHTNQFTCLNKNGTPYRAYKNELSTVPTGRTNEKKRFLMEYAARKI